MNPEELKNLGQFLSDSREASGLSLQKFSQVSGISEDILDQIESGDFKKIGSAPYLKGILKKYERFAGVGYKEVFGFVSQFKTSGKHDALPQNRFSSKSVLKLPEFNPVVFLLAILFFFLAFQFVVLVLPPKIVLGEMPTATSEKNVKVFGTVSGKVKDFFVNSEKTELLKNSFSKDIFLNQEINIIEFKAINFFGKEVVVRRMVILKSE
ncbi:MAG: hypothetical protein A2418_03130 [Candidatus Brennerbacteria bacterium RIFOXYC1_FULL_41_11]|uniref:HTH cro/C1-type domain-containing protein n=1 Tax=Candidatus Brennerbacteria bacterium RIFOXYD1_FULL_41_16 TaxID=1797529 RepID=A0A1G1XLL6_9BACT|nr:MAG: hypothetical protein A2391_00735 [Candidatus Brennerbacteria bacterium RIFOXYB1_FULL_41_13]OGY39825.1 MAG: hypothetical protein A2418_03130 [Candidatus Brennerbacteria bacterium RIFOXYC1_FULL_41_11]OGY40576.1 MAG: hypothetical protein A2570_02470 [Candidatus Brennerbacteria bacterium RIFOXYD1_FULL_41_16]